MDYCPNQRTRNTFNDFCLVRDVVALGVRRDRQDTQIYCKKMKGRKQGNKTLSAANKEMTWAAVAPAHYMRTCISDRWFIA